MSLRVFRFFVFFSVRSKLSRSVSVGVPGPWTWSSRPRSRCWETRRRNMRMCCDWPERWPTTSTTWCRPSMHWGTPSLTSVRSLQSCGWALKTCSCRFWCFDLGKHQYVDVLPRAFLLFYRMSLATTQRLRSCCVRTGRLSSAPWTSLCPASTRWSTRPSRTPWWQSRCMKMPGKNTQHIDYSYEMSIWWEKNLGRNRRSQSNSDISWIHNDIHWMKCNTGKLFHLSKLRHWVLLYEKRLSWGLKWPFSLDLSNISSIFTFFFFFLIIMGLI